MARKKQDGPSATRIYYVTAKSGDEWLVRAVSQTQAIRRASAGKQVVNAVPEQEEIEA